MQIFSASLALVAALATSVTAQSNSSQASNFTYQVNWPANIKVLPSVAYANPKFDLSTLPKFSWSLLNESEAFRNTLCTQQMSYCDKAGCDAAQGANAQDVKVHDNWCNPSTMAVKCTCVSGTSRLQQYQWPVQTQDCRMRGQACQDQCRYGGTLTADMASCVSNCENIFGMNCGLAGQISASYAVMSRKDSPSLALMQGGDSQSPAALNAQTSVALVAAVALVASISSLL